MGFWDNIKSLFGGAPSAPQQTPAAAPAPAPATPAASSNPWMEAALSSVTAKAAMRQDFAVLTLADAITAKKSGRTAQDIRQACDAVRAVCDAAWMAKNNYQTSHRATFYPAEQAATVAAPVPVVKPAPSPSAPIASAPVTPKAPPKPSIDPYEAKDILALPADELRKRALKIDPYRTAWIGRVDTIPPQSDERTALIDRGLVLRGLLTEDELKEIHRVGDLWIKFRLNKSDYAANEFAKKTADEAVAQLKAGKAEKKAEKQRLAEERAEQRREEIEHRRETDIIFLGRGVSSKLNDRRANIEALERAKLPVLATPADVAKALELDIPGLRWLCFHSEAVEKPHYSYFEVPKRSGGKRMLSAPKKELAAAQRWILQNILMRLPQSQQAHGFITGRSTLTNARPHVGQDVVVNLDLSNFFPTIVFPRVRGFFEKLGYSPAAATILALICTESPRQAADYDGKRYWIATGPRGLPQGACTSPPLSNQIARKLDRRLTGMCGELGWQYTRYADDLTFSAPEGKRPQIGQLMAKIRHIVEDEGFKLNPKKGRVQRAGARQTVTGIVVNEKASLPREEVRRLRAILHGARKTGLAAQNRQGLPHFESWLRGKLAYLAMVDPDKGFAMLREMDELTRRSAKVG